MTAKIGASGRAGLAAAVAMAAMIAGCGNDPGGDEAVSDPSPEPEASQGAVSAETRPQSVPDDVSEEAAYLVFNYRVTDRDAYDRYVAAVPATLEPYDAEIVVADTASEVIESDAGEVTVVLKFRSREAARDWYSSPDYQAIVRGRLDHSNGIATLAVAN